MDFLGKICSFEKNPVIRSFELPTPKKELMSLLKSLVKLVTKYVPQKPDIVYFDLAGTGSENPHEKSVRLIKKGEIPDDKIPGRFNGFDKGSDAFRKHESRLVKKLLNMLLLADYSDTPMSTMLKAELEWGDVLPGPVDDILI